MIRRFPRINRVALGLKEHRKSDGYDTGYRQAASTAGNK
jgi:hypothetical protein